MSAQGRSFVPAPFRVKSFRFQWPADLTTSLAMEMETIILGWYVLVETGSVLLLALFGSLQQTGTLVAPIFGSIGDRVGHRNLLRTIRACFAAGALVLMALAFTGTLRPVHVFVIAGFVGLLRSSDQVMRFAIIGETVPPLHLMGAMSISRTTGDTARIVGALTGAGLVTQLGLAPAYVVIAGLYAASFALTFGIASAPPDPSGTQAQTVARPSHWRDLRESFAYAWREPPILVALLMAFLVNLTAFPFVNALLPYVAKEIYHMEQSGLGHLVASYAFGALLGSISLSLFGDALRPGRMMIAFSAVWFVLLIVFGQVQDPAAGLVLLFLSGIFQSLAMVVLSVLLLRSSERPFRGRVMGMRMLAVYGLPIGLMATGPLIERFGFAATITGYCIFGVICTILIAAYWREHIWSRDAPANRLAQ